MLCSDVLHPQCDSPNLKDSWRSAWGFVSFKAAATQARLTQPAGQLALGLAEYFRAPRSPWRIVI
jgi:hypothetical protein